MDEVDLTEVRWFELQDGEKIIIQQNCLFEEERSNEFDEIIMDREGALQLAYKIIEALEDK